MPRALAAAVLLTSCVPDVPVSNPYDPELPPEQQQRATLEGTARIRDVMDNYTPPSNAFEVCSPAVGCTNSIFLAFARTPQFFMASSVERDPGTAEGRFMRVSLIGGGETVVGPTMDPEEADDGEWAAIRLDDVERRVSERSSCVAQE